MQPRGEYDRREHKPFMLDVNETLRRMDEVRKPIPYIKRFGIPGAIVVSLAMWAGIYTLLT